MRRVLTAIAAALAFAAAAGAAAPGGRLFDPVVVATGSWPPFVDDDARENGVASEIVSAALLDMGRRPELAFVPTFDQALRLAGDGRAAAAYPFFRSAERERSFLYSDPIADVEYVIFASPETQAALAGAGGLDALDGLRTARAGGYYYGPLEDHIAAGAPTVANEAIAFERLLDGEIDYVAASRLAGEALIDAHFFDRQRDVRVVENPALSWTASVHLVAARSDPDAAGFIADFNASLAALNAGGLSDLALRRLRDDARDRRVVILSDPGSYSLVTAKPDLDSAETYVLPRGSRAVVVAWGENFVEPQTTTVHDQLNAFSQVKLLNGPLKGETVWVRNLFIELPQ